MWVPRDVHEIEAAIANGDLEETSSFDGKADLPSSPKKNADVAVDVAAMSTEGGSILYGVKEDEHKRLTERTPILLAGAAERIAQIVQTSISEVPHIQFRSFHLPDDPSRGYLLVIVPPSPRAPHQVTVRNDRRFYGRGATGNRLLSEQEVALLYSRRQQAEMDNQQQLAEATASPRFAPARQTDGCLYALVRPVLADQSFWGHAADRCGGEEALKRTLERAASPVRRDGASYSDGQQWRREGADVWRLSNMGTDPPRDEAPRYLIDVAFYRDGSAHLFAGAAAGYTNPDGPKWIWERNIAASAETHLRLASSLYTSAGYFGAVDIGIKAANLAGGISQARYSGHPYLKGAETFTGSDYQRGRRLAAASELEDPQGVVRTLFADLFRTTAGRDDFDPFAEPDRR